MPVRRDIVHPAELAALKVEFAGDVREFGGQEAAAAYLETSQQHLSDCGSVNTDRFPTIDKLFRLSAATRGRPGWPRTIGAMARALGCTLVVLPPADPADGKSLAELIACQAKEAGEVTSHACGLLSARGKPSRDTLRQVIKEADEGIAAMVNLRAYAARMLGE